MYNRYTDPTRALFSPAKAAHEIELSNFELAKDKYAYDQALQQEIFQREDNSIQRRVADLRAAGLSPVLAAGQGARAGSPIPVTAPKRDTRSLELRSQNINNFIGRLADITKTIADTAYTNAQIQGTRASTAETIQRTRHAEEYQPIKIRKGELENLFAGKSFDERYKQLLIANQSGQLHNISQQNANYLSGIDVTWRRALEDHLRKTPGAKNPEILRVQAADLAKAIAQYDWGLYKEMGQPVHGNAGLYKILMGFITQITGEEAETFEQWRVRQSKQGVENTPNDQSKYDPNTPQGATR